MNQFTIHKVNNEKSFQNFITKLKKAPVIVIDTEFTRKNTYFPIFSLLQISINKNEAYILDNLENHTLVLATIKTIYNSNAVKVIHSARNDLELFVNIMHTLPSNVFDTQIAYMALSSSNSISYAGLIKDLFNKNLNKSLSISNWNNRPLSNMQINYAALDVIYLYDAYFKIVKLLKKKKRLTWIDNKISELYDISLYKFNLEKYFTKYVSLHNINQNFNSLAAVLDWRENLAIEHNVPRQFIINDDTIKQLIKAEKELPFYKIKLSKFINKDYLFELLTNTPNKYTNFDNLIGEKVIVSKHHLLDIAYNLLNFTCSKLVTHQDLITNKNELNLYLNNIVTEPKFNHDWRYKVFGKQLYKLLNGKLSLRIKNQQIYFK
ncbi:hypothetical protein ACFX5K_04210 [Rickettsiales bacterium LUAb2]